MKKSKDTQTSTKEKHKKENKHFDNEDIKNVSGDDKSSTKAESDSENYVSVKEYEEIKAKYLRALADYENLEKRLERERQNASMLANEVLVEKLLPVLDDLDEAIKHIQDDGLKQVQKKLIKALLDSGVEIIDPTDHEEFDPNLHEAVESAKGKSNKIVKVYRKGYRLGNKVLRPALVAVGNGNA